jgi:hypothetical protein
MADAGTALLANLTHSMYLRKGVGWGEGGEGLGGRVGWGVKVWGEGGG